MKTFLPALISLYVLVTTRFAAGEHPLIIIIRSKSNGEVRFPHKLEENGSWTRKPEDRTFYFCPAENQADKTLLEKYKAELNDVEEGYCLIDKPMNQGTDRKSVCQTEPKPVIKPSQHEGNKIKCGLIYEGSSSYMQTVQYQLCGPRANIQAYFDRKSGEEKTLPALKAASIYKICYDEETNYKLYTEHHVWSIGLFNDERIPKEEIEYSSTDVNTDSFSIKNAKFDEIKKAYEERNLSYKVVPHQLVPKQHMVFKWWKKATQHILNTAPLWEDLVQLMEFIDNGIKNYSIQTGKLLKVYTAAFHHNDVHNEIEYLDQKQSVLFTNLWIKIVHHHETPWQHAVIFIHNRPNNPPNDGNKLCTDLKFNFDPWKDDKYPITDDLLQYAYVCKLNKEIEDWLFLKAESKGLLDFTDTNKKAESVRISGKEDNIDVSPAGN